MALQYAAIAELGVCLTCFLPAYKHKAVSRERLSKRIIPAALAAFVAVPLTIAAGIYLFGNRKYYFISLLIILEIMIPFFAGFEKKHPRGREIVIISVLCAMAIAGRTAFYFLPQFKPVLAIIIIAGACLGSETGFIVGAITGFVSNFFFGQGPWTPWQMFAFGIIGFIAGIIFRCGLIKPNRITLSIFGAFATIVIFGGIMNPSSVLQWQAHPSAEMFISAYAVALPFDILHAFATAFFLWFISEPVMEKLERVKIKYGLMQK
ncbi:MAG: ECF transporter S component [Clostridia bacterium]|nr:ECF transporter S component [Clostridia bacterium]